jgi:hypothetical protein
MKKNFTATVKEGDGDRNHQAPVWVLIEPDEEIGLRPNESIVIDFDRGTPIEKAEEVARFLNHNAPRFRIQRL